METSKLTAEGIIGEAVRIGAKMSGGEFPIEVFPIRIQRIISSLHDCQGYPVDYVAAAILAAIAVGIGNSHLVQVKRNWLESPILYMALIGRPGANKSHPLSFAFQPFIEHDYCQNQEYQKSYAEYERTMSMSKKEHMEAGLDEFPQASVRRRFLVSDITPEGLSLIHAQNPRGLCLWSDELSAWFKNFNRYNNGSEEQFWLSVFNAKPTISDRKSTQSSIFIRRPYISVIGTIQKKILGELVKGERSSNGFIDRILFVMPESVLKSRWNDRETPEELEIQWQQIIDKLIAQDCPHDENNELQPQCLPFDEDAKQRLYGWQHENARQCDMETNDALVGIYCKLEIYIIRFCLIIQLARWTCGECDKHTIDLESVNRAILLTEYFRTTAVKVQTAVSQKQLSELHRNIYLNLPQRFTTAEGIGIAESYGVKEPHNYITWVHSLLKKENFHLRQCLFGEHLLSSDQQRPVALVESEKSALISSFYLPQYLWIASGGKNGAFNRDAMNVLRNRRVLLFPDLGATDYWNSKMEMIRNLEIEVSLFDFMERNATKEERDAGYDIADFLLREETKDAIFNRLITLNPALKTLVETFDLQLDNVEKAPLSATVQHTRKGLFKR